MRITLLFLLVLTSACTAPNPQSCTDGTCTDPAYPYCDADGTFQEHPGTCIAVTCNAGEFETCKGTREALRCNATGNDYELTQCERGCIADVGGCVECVDNTQCSNPTPYCSVSSRTCEVCTVNEDCESQVCDATRGECVDPATVVYVAPTGSPAGNCGTQETPCALERGIARLDATLKILKIAPGDYNSGPALSLGGTVTIYGHGAKVPRALFIIDPAQVQVRGLTLGGLNCQKDAGQPSVDLDLVTLAPEGSVFVSGCVVNIRRSRIMTMGARPIFLVAGITTAVTVDRTWFENSSSNYNLGIYAEGGIQITNSVFRNMPRPIDHPSGASNVSFSTFIDSPLRCMGGAQYNNNILFATTGDSILDPAEDYCQYSHNLMSRQSVPPSMVNMNKVGDPGFVDAQAGDFHLRPGSPAIDSAVQFPAVTADFDGTPRPQGARLDIGAFEYKP